MLSLLAPLGALLLLASPSEANNGRRVYDNGGNDYHYSTGVTRKFTFDVSEGYIAPDGFSRSAILINGITPGPEIVIDEGDQVEVTVNNAAGRDITFHWHGIEQYHTPWSDGVAGVSQYPIADGDTFVYEWKATQHGFYWYHSHNRALIEDGLRGVIFIRPRPGRPNPFALVPGADYDALVKAEKNSVNMLLHDYTHIQSEKILELWNTTGIEPLCMQAMLANGKGHQVCPSPEVLAPYNAPPRNLSGPLTAQGCIIPTNPLVYFFNDTQPDQVDPEMYYDCAGTSTTELEEVVVDPSTGWAAINLVNGGSNWELVVSIDEHKMWVFAADGSYIEPTAVDAISIPNGERYSVFVKLDKKVGSSYNIRIAANVLPQVLSGYALLTYRSTSAEQPTGTVALPAPTATASSTASIGYGGELLDPTKCNLFNASYHPPYPAYAPPTGDADVTFRMDIGRASNLVYVLNQEPFQLWRDLGTPALFDPSVSLAANLSFPYKSGQIIDMILSVAPPSPPHPIHKHGVKGWVIAQGDGPFNWSSVAEAAEAVPQAFNWVNPPFRDNFNTPPALAGPAWTVVRFVSNDPSPTFIHCHLSLHLSSGMAAVLLESMEDLPTIPERYYKYAQAYSGKDWSPSARVDEHVAISAAVEKIAPVPVRARKQGW